MAVQVDNPIFYVDGNFGIFYRAENIIFPESAVNGIFYRRVRFLDFAQAFCVIYHLTAFCTPGEFVKVCCGYLCREHIYSLPSLVWIFVIDRASRRHAFAENGNTRLKFESVEALI
jgi:hypothetical protein